jgi:hypothetical protein
VSSVAALEAGVARAARALQAVPPTADTETNAAAERALADSMEHWIAALLSTEKAWPLRGRWYDGLVFQERKASEGDEVAASGWIYRVDTHEKCPFSGNVSTLGARARSVRRVLRERAALLTAPVDVLPPR